MLKKRPDKQNKEEPPFSLPQPAAVDDEAFARRAGETIANSSTSLHKPKGVGSNKRPIGAQRMSGDAVSAPLEQRPAGDGPTVFAHACKLGLEGIISQISVHK